MPAARLVKVTASITVLTNLLSEEDIYISHPENEVFFCGTGMADFGFVVVGLGV